MRAYERPTFIRGAMLQVVTAQVLGCVSPFHPGCFLGVIDEPPPPPPPPTP
jgi:hypothetical protein